MATIGEIFALIDRLKRNVARNAQDIPGSLSQGVSQLRENFQQDPTGTVLNSANIGGLLGVGMTKPTAGFRGLLAPQEEALQIAQRNAVEMLGLPPNNTAMDRAKAMGFHVNRESSKQAIADAPIVNYYHATGRNQQAFPEISSGYNTSTFSEPESVKRYATFLTPDAEFANNFASQYKEGANILPLMLRTENYVDLANGINNDSAKLLGLPSSTKYLNPNAVWQIFDNETGKKVSKKLKSKGYDSVYLNEENPITGNVAESIAVLDPSKIRSRFAAFDPARRNEANLLASRVFPFGLPGLLGIMGMKEEE